VRTGVHATQPSARASTMLARIPRLAYTSRLELAYVRPSRRRSARAARPHSHTRCGRRRRAAQRPHRRHPRRRPRRQPSDAAARRLARLRVRARRLADAALQLNPRATRAASRARSLD